MAWVFVLFLLFISASATVQTRLEKTGRATDNPADQIVAGINANRTASKSPPLYSNPGLACVALQYIKAYQGDCTAVYGPNARKPADSEFAETFAPECGVETSTLAPITGRLLGCQPDYVNASSALSEILVKDGESVGVVLSRNHTEVGAAVSGSDGGGPYFWCVLFSGGVANRSFVLEGNVAKISRPGCFSGANDECSGAGDFLGGFCVWLIVVMSLIGYGFGI